MSTVYATAQDLRTQLGVLNPSGLSDDVAEALILEAEDEIDRLLGGWPVDETTGRKITEADVEAWQWAKLQRATLLLAQALYAQPDLLTRQSYRRSKGPDFEFEDPIGAGKVSRVVSVLDDSGLRRLAGRAVPGRRRRYPESCERW